MFQVYQPSGRFSLLAIPLVGIGAVLVVAAAYVYQLGLEWIPFIYVNVLLTWVMAMLIGKTTEYVIHIGHVRNIALCLLFFALVVVAGLGAKFGFQYMHARISLESELANMTQSELRIEADPPLTYEEMKEVRQEIMAGFSFVDHIEMRVANGWNIGRANAPITGPFVYLVWVVELGIILYFGSAIALAAVRKPYSEKRNRWADSVTIEMTLPITNPLMVAKISSAKSVQELLELPIPDTDQSNKIAVYEVHSVPNSPEEDAYLNVDLQTHSVNAKGELEVAHEFLVKLAIITAAQRAQLKENSELMQEALAAYRASVANPPTEPTGDQASTDD
ncbi:MAG: hypothetical protein Q8M16_06320 [Pirellulaceae bacterium]|nr:hypothetical protein [Pirellulaceae bacterium]